MFASRQVRLPQNLDVDKLPVWQTIGEAFTFTFRNLSRGKAARGWECV
jgi:hypothetical protein